MTVIRLNGERLTRRNLRLASGKLLTPAGVDLALKEEAERMEKFFPELEFRLVPLRDGNFYFVEVKAAAGGQGSVVSEEQPCG